MEGVAPFTCSLESTIPGSYLGQFLLGMCRWPLRAPTSLKSILRPVIDSTFVAFGKICNFRDPNLVTSVLFTYEPYLNKEHFTFHRQYKHSGTFANRKYEELSCPKNQKMFDPILVTLLKMIVNPVVKIRPHRVADLH